MQTGHWGTVLLLVPAFVTGFAGSKALGGSWHASLGLAVLALILARLLLRVVSRMAAISVRLSSLLYAALYSIAIMLALTGLTAGQRSPFTPPPSAFGLQLPQIPVVPTTVGARAHTALAYLLLALIGVHLLSLLARRLNGERGVLARMLPFGRYRQH